MKHMLVLLVFSSLVLSQCQNQGAATKDANQNQKAEAVQPNLNPSESVYLLDETGYALSGYDPVEYHQTNNAVEGLAKHQTKWGGALWKFSSSQNLEAFVKEPERYAPSNGGYCTFGVVLGKVLDGNPKVWRIYNEELFLFLDEDVKQKFLQDLEGNIRKVKQNWPDVVKSIH